MTLRTLIVGNPENRRISLFQAALAQRGEPAAEVVPWLEVVSSRVDWASRLRNVNRVRLESPGENAAVERALIAAGDTGEADTVCPHADQISACEAAQLSDDPGLIRYPRQWYRGLRRILRQLDEHAVHVPGAQWNHSVKNILCMFDKVECQHLLDQAGISIPATLPLIHSYDELLHQMNERGIHRVFVKLAHSSSASGVVALERGRSGQQAYTSAQLIRTNGQTRLYNSLKVRCYTRTEDIRDLIDTLVRERVQVEAWLPKASYDERRFDLRVVVIGGQARHVVVRVSRQPMTNLHLGNSRGDTARIMETLGPEAWAAAMATCERAMRSFPGSLYAGIDLLIRNDYRRHAVLEVNAFGDLLPNVWHNRESTYDAELSAQPVFQKQAGGVA